LSCPPKNCVARRGVTVVASSRLRSASLATVEMPVAARQKSCARAPRLHSFGYAEG
jgi:hypothetical protein